MDSIRQHLPHLPVNHEQTWRLNWLAGPGDFFLLILILIPAVFPLVRDGFPQTADGNLHMLRLVLLDHQVSHGVFLPQWTPQLFLGYGYPVFHFYAPATYYLGLLLTWLGLSQAQAFIGVFVVLTLLGGVGMRLLACDVLSADARQPARWPALLSAVAYVYSPYLLTNIYVRGAIAELGAQALLPWIFWSFRRLFRTANPASYVLPAALSLGALALTHNISLLFVPPVLLLYLLLLGRRDGVRNGRSRIKWAAGAGGLAVLLSAFFWLPLLAERRYLADTAYRQSAELMAGHFWIWSNFLDQSLRFVYDTQPPFQLGLWQLVLAAVGFFLARRRDWEWLFWLGVALVGGLGMGSWARSVWTGSEVLLIAQFPWRLLAIVTLALALLTGGLLTKLRSQPLQLLLALAVVGTILLANTPGSFWAVSANPASVALTAAHVTAYEAEVGALGTSSTQEFLPRWVQTLALAEAPPVAPILSEVSLAQAGDLALLAEVAAGETTPLRWTNFYFPGWRVTLEDGTALVPYPSTSLGLLTVDVPAGRHQLTLSWQPTAVQRTGAVLTLIGAVVLAVFLARQAGLRRWTAVPLLFLLLALVIFWGPTPQAQPVSAPAETAVYQGISLLGYQAEQDQPGTLNLHVYWYAAQTPRTFNPVWLLEDTAGTVVGRTASLPYLGAVAAQDWPANTLVDDAYTLFYPPQLSGSHRLYLAIEGETPRHVGTVNLAAGSPDSPTLADSDVLYQFGDYFLLGEHTLMVNGRTTDPKSLPIVAPGDRLEYRLEWQLATPPPLNFHGSLQLTDANWQMLAQKDQILGAPFHFPQLWNPYMRVKDSYRLQIPADAPGGLYWPRLAVYNYTNGQRLSVAAAGEAPFGDVHTLPPVKVVGNGRADPQIRLTVDFGDMAQLVGYDLTLPTPTLRAGDTFTLTLIYRSQGAAPIDYQQFIHLRHAELGMAVQADKAPQDGSNPTTAWQPGEIIKDTTLLTVPADAAPGTYTLYIGFYNPQDGVRLPVQVDGQPQTDNQLAVTQIEIVSNP